MGGGLVAGEQHQHAGRDQFVFAQRALLVARGDHPADEVLAGRSPTSRDHLAKKTRQLGCAVAGSVVAVGVGARRSDEGAQVVRPGFQIGIGLVRDAQQVEDHIGRQRHGHLLRPVHRLVSRQRVEQLVDDSADRIGQRLYRARRESRADQATQPRVFGRVTEHHPQRQVAHHLSQDLAPLTLELRIERPQPIGRHDVGHRDLTHVVIAREHPAAKRLAPVHRVVVLQLAVDGERVAPHLGSGWVVGHGHGAQATSAGQNWVSGFIVTSTTAGAGNSAIKDRCAGTERPKAGRSRPPPVGIKQSGKATFA